MKITAISDLHGQLPPIRKTDLLIVAGDVCPVTNHGIHFQAQWLGTEFKRWVEEVPADHVVLVAGNHDFVFERGKELILPMPNKLTYLEDTGCLVADREVSQEPKSLKLYGSPYTSIFFNWAFNLSENELKKKWAVIPDGVDILITHGPPRSFGDKAPRLDDLGYEHVGSPSLLERIKAVSPKLCVFGHIHAGRGLWQLGKTTLANVSLLNDAYQVVHEPMEFEL